MGDQVRVLGSLRTVDGQGVVRMEESFGVGVDMLWAAVTEPGHLARWYGEVDGDLRPGGEFRLSIAVSGERHCQVLACEPPEHLLVAVRDPDARPGQPEHTENEVWVAAEDDGESRLVWEVRGLPVDLLPAYGTGVQLHVEHLSDHLAGRGQRSVESRWDVLLPAYEARRPG